MPGMPGKPGIPGMPPPLPKPAMASAVDMSFIMRDSPSMPPICSNICGFNRPICCAICAMPFCIACCPFAPPPPPCVIFPRPPNMAPIDWKEVMSSVTSCGCMPEPRAMRRMRLRVSPLRSRSGLSSSFSVMESRIAIMWRIRCLDIWSVDALSMLPMPGSMPMMRDSEPIDPIISNCDRMSRKEKLPEAIFLASSSWFSMPRSRTVSASPLRSPMPSSRDTKDSGSNASRSSICSPTPRKRMGEPVAATADSAPPPLA
mmetsp:Transcript_436/g.1324  ORF Transcript_436/g.1324 Transcript_436/m.1324 type:complete len:259 (+) Transcript_436:245-1021(+)